MMNRSIARFFVMAAVTGLAGVNAGAELVRNPTQFGANIDAGQIISGTIYKKGDPEGRAKGQMLTRTGVYMTESAVYNERLSMAVTFGGLFWIPLPEETNDPQNRRVLFGPGVGQAQATYVFGADPSDPAATLQFGLFPYKYSESTNLGEYLYRSGAYPGYIMTGGWSYLNASAYLAQGLRLTVPMLGGLLTHDVTLFMERDIEPARDISPGYLLTVRPASFVTLRAGGVWAHGIPFQSSKNLTPKSENNAYSKSLGLPIDDGQGGLTPSPCADQINNNLPRTDCGYYTFRGFKVVGGGALDLGMLLGGGAIAPGDFQVYGEIALLGVKDYPYLYDDKTERMPVTAGVSLPTFGLLDHFAVEGEYRRTRFPNTIGSAYQNQLPLPVGSQESPYLYTNKKTSWKWSVYARRELISGVSVHAQAANDHMRHFSTLFADPHHRPATEKNTDWYYVLRLEFGI